MGPMLEEITTVRNCGAVQKERAAQGGKHSHPPSFVTPSTHLSFYDIGQRVFLTAVLPSLTKRKFL